MDLSSSDVWAADVKIQSDGKTVAVGYVYTGNFTYFAIFRFTSTGAPDSTFGGGDGIATAFEGLGRAYPNSLFIQPNGSILSVGETIVNENRSFAVARHTPDGTNDTGFGTNGTAVIGFTGPSAGQSAAVQTDGKLVLAGWNYTNNIGQFALVRLNANGALDSTFGSNGQVVTAFVDGASIDDTAITTDGRIIAIGTGYGSDAKYFLDIARYMPNGSLDTTFDGDGKLEIQTGRQSYDYAYAVAELPGGKYLSIGNSNDKVAITRHSADGTLDASFDGDGRLLTNHGLGVTDAIVQSDGKIVVTGNYYPSNESLQKVIRLNSDGTTDTSFGSGGTAEVAFPGFRHAYSHALAVQTDGKYVLAGQVDGDGNPNIQRMALARLNSDGTLDNTFDGDGRVVTDINGFSGGALTVKIQPDGKILAAGHTYVSSGSGDTFSLVRYNLNGSLDTTFDGDGKVTTVFPTTPNSFVNDLGIQSDGKIVAVGAAGGGPSYGEAVQTFGIARYNSNGSLDTTFDGDGLLTTSFGNLYSYAASVRVRPNGKIIVAGSKYNYDSYNDYQYDASIVVTQYNNDGTPDSGFGNGGRGEYLVPEKYANAATLTSDDKLIIAGSAYGYESDFLITRIQLNATAATWTVRGRVTAPKGVGPRNPVLELTDS